MTAAIRNFRGHDQMPFNLKAVMLQHGISQADLAAAVRQSNGTPMSRPAMNFIVNHGYFPSSTDAAEIRRQIETYITGRGATAAEIASLWQPRDEDDLRHAQPPGAHLGKPAGTRRRAEPKTAPAPEPEFPHMEVEMLSPQAKKHFRLFRDPFANDITAAEDVFQSESQRYVVEAMLQTALLGGITAVIGESGSGKTTLRKLLMHRIARDRHPVRVVFPQALDKTKLSTGSICAAIIKDLEPETGIRSSLEAQARQVKDVLLRSSTAGEAGNGFKHLLLIEEAHDLNVQTLKYLKRFHEIESATGFGSVLSIVLIAQPEMRLKLDAARHPEAREFINRCEVATLEPLYDNLAAYLAHKLTRVGVEPGSVFAADAYDAVRARWTRVDPHTRAVRNNLYPLIVNNTVTRAMNRAADLGVPLVTGDLIREI